MLSHSPSLGLLLTGLVVVLVVGCGKSPSPVVAGSAGSTPALGRGYGVRPSNDSIAKLRVGMREDQLIDLLGPSQTNEISKSAIKTLKWNYEEACVEAVCCDQKVVSLRISRALTQQ